jgi:serine/threonine protein kinase
MGTPDRLGKYEITEVLGQGAMGLVFKGFDPSIHRIVAIKTIRGELIEGDRAAGRMLAHFRNEALGLHLCLKSSSKRAATSGTATAAKCAPCFGLRDVDVRGHSTTGGD